jgi:hypothetical protein
MAASSVSARVVLALPLVAALGAAPVLGAPLIVPPDTIQVAPPTGSPDTDRTRVQEAFDRAQPGDTVLFTAGTYRMGAGARLTVPDVTVLGHPDGTVLQGCEPERFALPEGFTMDEVGEVVFGCTGLHVLADRQTIRGLTFDHTWHGLVVGQLSGPPGEGPPPPSYGGHRIEGNVFRHVPNGIRVLGPTDDVTVIRDNVVLNAYHAFQSNGAPVHVIDNRISVPDPGSVPSAYYPESGVIVSPGPAPDRCRGSLVAGNVIEGTVHGIQVLAGPGRDTCADHVIRDNVIRVEPVPLPPGYPAHLRDFYFAEGAEGSTVTGTAIRLDGAHDGTPDSTTGPTIRNVLVQNNRVLGGAGLGIQLRAATDARIIDNHITGIRRRSPFPGPTWGDDPELWRDANGAAIWVSDDSHENLVAGNTFDDIEGAVVHASESANEIRLRTDDEAAVLGVVDSALERISAEDLVGFTDLMIPGAAIGAVGVQEGQRFAGMRSRDEERGQVWAEDVVERGFDAEVMLSGPLAMVWLPYDLYVDGAWSHCGVDVFTLFRTDAGWQIATVTYSVEQPPACRRHPAGPPGG